MNAMNKRMRKELEPISFVEKEIPPELQDLLASGFVELDGCFFLKSLKELCLTASVTDFPDKVGFECFVNSVHLDDFVASDYLVAALLFLEAVFQEWRGCQLNRVLQGVVCKDEFGVLVKLHLLRAGEFWVDSNLEAYEDAMLVADSTEVIFPLYEKSRFPAF